ncbi:2-oxoglutarate receptor 1 [Hypomesus transpacificus]|uniref:2-oxoglutarate receptor 1 n=1 Tax=Hypomesus transpacificus TaxID=137520 RepID=UPI001F0731D8|nr:2-oxoglutarate receptor 1 [Hypomesus transpacificus]
MSQEKNNCTSVDESLKSYYLPVMYSIICVVGLVGNIISITIYLVKLRPWKSSSIIMVNLAIADLLYASSMPLLIHNYISGKWIMHEIVCKFVRFSFHFNLYGSILFLTCLSVFRYVVVLHPLRAAQVQRKSWGILACLAVWLVSLAEISPMLTMVTVEKKGDRTVCLDFASNDPAETVWLYGWLLTVLGYLLPLVVVSWSYICIARELKVGPHNGQSGRVRARKLTVMILVVFVLCFMPYHILRCLRLYTRTLGSVSCILEKGVNAAYIISRPLAGLNTFFNLALYTLAGDRFQQALLGLLQWRPSFTRTSISKPNINSISRACLVNLK